MKNKLEDVLSLIIVAIMTVAVFAFVVAAANSAARVFGAWAGIAVIVVAIIIALLVLLGGVALFREEKEGEK